jgi:hypothetical protein
MPKESYVTPEVKSEILEPEALQCGGSGFGNPQGNGGFWGSWARWSWWWK